MSKGADHNDSLPSVGGEDLRSKALGRRQVNYTLPSKGRQGATGEIFLRVGDQVVMAAGKVSMV